MKIYRTILFIFLFMNAFTSRGQEILLSPCVNLGDEIPVIAEYNEKL